MMRRLFIGAPLVWLLAFFAAPFVIVAGISLVPALDAVPPFASPLNPANWTLDSYRLLIHDDLYVAAFANALRIAFTATAIALLIGYPMAYAMARAPERWRGLLVMLVIVPFWTSFLIRVYAWMLLLRPSGLINSALMGLGIVAEPLPLDAGEFAVHLGLVYSYLPFMVLPLYATLERLDPALLEAAHDLGARPWNAFLRVTLPLSLPGIAAGSLLVFIPSVGEFIIPDLLGGADSPMIGKILWTEFFNNRDWPAASALAVGLLALLLAPILAFQAIEKRAASS
ncbi:MAG: ABC transporter permease subunit [Alphaproteobacteria bacterium]|nr:ABC transporter permease subunit [Alphaproteobacteria bacterium]